MSRYDIYRRIHKALRAFMADTLVALGRVDAGDACDVLDTLGRLEELLALCEMHALHENAFIHRAMEAGEPGSTARFVEDHEGHLRAIEELRALALRARESAEPARDLHVLYLRVALFVAENLEHMNAEETVNNAVLQRCYSDAQIMDIEKRLIASVAPSQSMQVMRWMLPGVSPAERIALVEGMRAAPPPVLEAVRALARTHLGSRDHARLEAALAAPAQAAAS